MSKVCVLLSRLFSGHSVFTNRRNVNLRPCTRMLSVTSQLNAKSRKPPDDEEEDEKRSQPIKFSSSRASHRAWSVDRTMGSNYQRPWWKVLPISFFGVGFLIWCVFRRETEIDGSLEKNLHEHLPELLSNEEEEKDGGTNKPS